MFDARTGLSHLQTVRISMDMATQRMGRAGRVAEGVCYRLWTKASEHLMAEQRKPEIEEADLAPMVLDTAAFGRSPSVAHHAATCRCVQGERTAHVARCY